MVAATSAAIIDAASSAAYAARLVIFMSGPAQLGRNVRLLGTILGTVLVEQEGEWLLEIVERVRLLARGARRSGVVADVGEALQGIAAEQQALVLRAFAL